MWTGARRATIIHPWGSAPPKRSKTTALIFSNKIIDDAVHDEFHYAELKFIV